MAGKRPAQLFIDLLLCLALVAVLAILHFGVAPFKRGFFCNDESIQKPYVTKQTVPFALLCGAGFAALIIVIHLCEVANHFLVSRRKDLQVDSGKIAVLGSCSVTAWIYRLYARVWYSIVGTVITVLIVELGKRTVGRLRPHFLAVCKPNYSLFNCTDGYITADVCTGVAKQITEARVSFPSGHSAFAAYLAAFLSLYVHYVIHTKELKLSRPVLQVGFTVLALVVALGRISDYFHHWSDVLAGLLIGILVAYYTVKVIMQLDVEEAALEDERRIESVEAAPFSNGHEGYGATAMEEQHEEP